MFFSDHPISKISRATFLYYDMDNLGQKIKKIRELKNISRKYVANELMISTTSYGRIERNEFDITVKRLAQISAILNVRMSVILDFDEKKIFTGAD